MVAFLVAVPQLTFAHLAASLDPTFEPSGFWRAFKDYDGESIDIHEHQDAFEFLTRLMDVTDQYLIDSDQEPVLRKNLGGCFTQQVRIM